MRIAMFSDTFYPELSGIGDSILIMGEELAKRGHFITYFVPTYFQEQYECLQREKTFDLHPNIKVHRLLSISTPTGTGQGRMVLPIGGSFFNLRKMNPDLIHFHLFGGSALEAVWGARMFSKPLVATNHSPILEFSHYSPVQLKWIENLMHRSDSWLHNRCDFVSSPSRTIFESMKNFDEKIPHRVVSNPIDTIRFQAHFSKEEMKKRFGFRKFTILYLGRFASEKNIETILKAVFLLKERIPSFELVLVGNGIHEKALRGLAETLEISHLVKFLGFVPSIEEVVRIYNASDVFVMMSHAETQSISAMQAFSCKIPVIAASAWGLKEYIQKEAGFLIDPDNEKALAEKIFTLYSQPDLRQKMGEEGRKYVEKFSIGNIARQWEEIYEFVLRSRSSDWVNT
ncbi:MAG: glycosyltransferase family 4 protein [Chlamydiae bacterium]|nr:glycosyltransferase family 4 protein [Chlamydiota bacterium]